MSTASAKNRLTQVLAELRAQHGLALPAVDSDGICAFSMEHEGVTLSVYLQAFDEPDMVSMLCPVGRIDLAREAQGHLGKALLAANMLGLQTNGLALSWNPGDESIALGYSLFTKCLTPAALDEVLGRLVVAAAAWRERLSGGQSVGVT